MFRARQLMVAAVMIALAACNLPGSGQAAQGISVEQAAGTIVAMTMQAHGAGPANTPLPSAVPVTPTTKPTVYIHTDGAKCRSGPRTDFKVVATFNAGTSADLIAKDTTDGYWLVQDPTSGSSCWVQVQDATPAGSFDLLPEVTPQASVQKLPDTPSGPANAHYWDYTCLASSVDVTMRWSGAASNVTGYRIYRNGQQIADLAAGVTTYSDTTDYIFGSGAPLTYGVKAYNEVGESPALSTPTFYCQ
jgi:hypothetical protein